MIDILLLVFMIVGVVVAVVFISRWRMNRAISQVLKVLRNHNAVDAQSARTGEEMGIKSRGIIDGMFRTRDYKPNALQVLQGADFVRMTEEGKLYLMEDKLLGSKYARQ